jgi:hypothetical protein
MRETGRYEEKNGGTKEIRKMIGKEKRNKTKN